MVELFLNIDITSTLIQIISIFLIWVFFLIFFFSLNFEPLGFDKRKFPDILMINLPLLHTMNVSKSNF